MITLRPATPCDAAAILAIYAPYVENTTVSFELPAPSLVEFTARIAEICAEYPYLVAEENGVIVGYAYAHRHKERAAYGWNAELSVYLAPDFQGRGIGKRLYRALMELLARQNVRNVYGCVTMPNEKSAALHHSLGFTDAGIWHNSGFKFGAWRDVAWFEKAILAYSVPPEPFIPITAIAPEEIAAICASFCEE